jgi:glutathione S-transferase
MTATAARLAHKAHLYLTTRFRQTLSQEEPAKSNYWSTHGDPATATGARNGGAHFEYLNRLLKRAGGGGAWFVGGAPTAADFAVYDIVHLHARPMLFPEQMRAAVRGARFLALISEHGGGPCETKRYSPDHAKQTHLTLPWFV